jgi:hypothetical protein
MGVNHYCVPTRSRPSSLIASFTDLNQWVNVFGEKANASAAATFGGGCFAQICHSLPVVVTKMQASTLALP